MYVNGVDQGHTTGIRVPDYDGVGPSLPFLPSLFNILMIVVRHSLSRMLHPTILSAMVV